MPKITAKRLRFLLENQRYKCAMTGWDLTPETATIDHVIALSKGGKNTMDNVQIVHSLVNQAKHTMSMQQFVEMCRAVAAHADRKPD
jgi:5-methylcytosine-specific restriction endonuclease McrA